MVDKFQAVKSYRLEEKDFPSQFLLTSEPFKHFLKRLTEW